MPARARRPGLTATWDQALARRVAAHHLDTPSTDGLVPLVRRRPARDRDHPFGPLRRGVKAAAEAEAARWATYAAAPLHLTWTP